MIGKTRLAAAALMAFCGTAPAHAAGSICLRLRDIDHTEVVDSRTILFHMKDKTVYRNALRGPCAGLKLYGFSFHLRGTDQICSGAQAIHVLRTHALCLLGDFTQEPASGK